MLYTFGDSFSVDKKTDQGNVITAWPKILGDMLGVPVDNRSSIAGNNWRTARILNSLSLTPDDIIVIAWADNLSFEFGVNANYIDSEENGNYPDLLLDKQGDIVTKKYFKYLPGLTTDPNYKILSELAYTHFFNEEWYREMFRIMFQSCVYTLEKSGCNWLMFNTWRPWKNTAVPGYVNTPHYIYPEGSICTLMGIEPRPRYINQEETHQLAQLLFNRFNDASI